MIQMQSDGEMTADGLPDRRIGSGRRAVMLGLALLLVADPRGLAAQPVPGASALRSLAPVAEQAGTVRSGHGRRSPQRRRPELPSPQPERRAFDYDALVDPFGGDGSQPRTGVENPESACRISLGSIPWSEVWIDGQSVGVTPLVGLPVRCGRNTIVWKNRESAQEHREELTVSPGTTLKRIVHFDPVSATAGARAADAPGDGR